MFYLLFILCPPSFQNFISSSDATYHSFCGEQQNNSSNSKGYSYDIVFLHILITLSEKKLFLEYCVIYHVTENR